MSDATPAAERVLANDGDQIARIDVGNELLFIRPNSDEAGHWACERARVLKGREPVYRRDHCSADRLRTLCRRYEVTVLPSHRAGWAFDHVDYNMSVGKTRYGPDSEAVRGDGGETDG